MTSPTAHRTLAVSFDRIRRLKEDIAVSVGAPSDEAGWVSPAQWLRDPLLQNTISYYQDLYRTSARAIIGQCLVQDYENIVIGAAISSYVLEQRVPDLGMENILMHYSEDKRAVAMALRTARYTQLPSDPPADCPGVRVVPDQDSLRKVLRREIESNLGDYIQMICERIKCGPAMLWKSVADLCAVTLANTMQLKNPEIPTGELHLAIDGLIREDQSSPLKNRHSGVFCLEHRGKRHIFLKRASCCYAYKEDGCDIRCNVCPVRPVPERIERLKQVLQSRD